MESIERIKQFLSVSHGYGDGDGYDYGSGSGSGSGSGDGDGSGYGYGSGDGSGYDYCDGYDYGDGDGDGDGDDDGYGYGDLKCYNGQPVYYIDDTPTLIERIHNNYAKGYIIGDDLTLQPCYVAKIDNSFAHGETLKEAVRDAQNKALEDMPEDERIDKFCELFKTLDETHTVQEFYDWHHILTGSCEMGRTEFCKARGLDMGQKVSVYYFLDITENAYGGEIIRKVRERYGKMDKRASAEEQAQAVR